MAVQKQALAQIHKAYNLKKRVNNQFIPECEAKVQVTGQLFTDPKTNCVARLLKPCQLRRAKICFSCTKNVVFFLSCQLQKRIPFLLPLIFFFDPSYFVTALEYRLSLKI